MPLDLDAVGATTDPWTRTWTSADSLLYAVAVGAESLAFTTENSEGVAQRAVPTYAALIAGGSAPIRDRLGGWDPAAMVHAGQHLTWHRELPSEGAATLRTTVADITDKGSGALVGLITTASTADGPLFEARSTLFIRGEGGFGRTAGTRAEPAALGDPDGEIVVRTAENQALLYRLCGDRNPLHSDPAFARRAGFERPILHGLCTFGMTARVLLRRLLGDDPARLTSFGGRFRTPVLPGDVLRIRYWRRESGRVVFQTRRFGADRPAIDDGVLDYAPEAS
ncbi:MaoC family dehydratase [Actinophytocola oryzae]|uniref:Acyl dehydratase n=1 Tax=Actinophytocola oryzae TaxID=502181 RepID=A0A4V3FUU1_9PSEU|nr:MaoC family dehydratase [Actinophytocola oryzae]TDV56521.1 acyl dehydratase [Actinophytocola oryzae]